MLSNSVTDREKEKFEEVSGSPAVRIKPIEVEPTDTSKTNPSLALTYDGSNQLTGIAMTISGTTYNRTLTWVGGVCTAVSVWSTA